MKEIHVRSIPVRQLLDAMSIKYIPYGDENILRKNNYLSTALQQKNCNQYIS